MNRRTLITSLAVALLGLGLAACGGDGSGNSVTVPNVAGKTQAAASTSIVGAGLTVGTVTMQASSSVAAGDVIMEDPGAGAAVNGGTQVALFVSSGPPTPMVISGTVASGTALTGTLSVYDSSSFTQPRSTGNAIGTGGQYTLTVTGFTAPFLIQATGQVGGQGPAVSLYSVAIAAGTVNITPLTTLMALNMAAGNLQSLMTGSAGNLRGLTAADLSAQNTNMDTLLSSVLVAAGLSANYNFSTEAFTVGSAGYDRLLDDVSVNSASPSAVTVTNITSPATPITIDTTKGGPSGVLDITSGAATLSVGTLGFIGVPNVVGDIQSAAGTVITGAGLTVGTVTQTPSATISAGEVISENPAAGASVAKGSAVALVVSTGPQTFSIGGTVIGLGTSATVHVVNGADTVSISANGSFTLPTALVAGGDYSVAVGTPTSSQTCAVQNGSGTVASSNVTNVVVYCTYDVTTATLHNAYTEIEGAFDLPLSGTTYVEDYEGQIIYDGAGNWNITATLNDSGVITPNYQGSGAYAVSTTNALPTLGGAAGIEGVNADAVVWLGGLKGSGPPSIYVDVLPNAGATTDSVNGAYTQVFISADPSTGAVTSGEGPLTLANGAMSGSYTKNDAGTISANNPTSAQFTIAAGVVTVLGDSLSGAISADDDLIAIGDINSGDDPRINVLVPQASAATQGTFEGVYCIVQYGGTPDTITFGKVMTLFAYGNGTYSVIFTKKNGDGSISTDNTDTGTYTVATDGTLTIINSEGDIETGAVSADGNTLVLASVSAEQNPSIFVGVRQ